MIRKSILPDRATTSFVRITTKVVLSMLALIALVSANAYSQLEVVGELEIRVESPSIFVAGSYAYLATYDTGLVIVDVSDPSSPSIAAICRTPDWCEDVDVSGDYAYIAGFGSGLQVVDVSDPFAPAIAGSCDSARFCHGLSIQGDYVYSASCNHFMVIDISVPSEPEIVFSHATSSELTEVEIEGATAYARNGGIIIYDIADPIVPDSLGSYLGAIVLDLAIRDSIAYITTYDTAFAILSVADPRNIRGLGRHVTYDQAYRLKVAGDYAFVSVRARGLQVFNIADPGNIFAVDIYFDYGPGDLFVDGDLIYLTSWSGLVILRFPPITSIHDDYSDLPVGLFLGPNYPNPFNSSTSISYSIAASGHASLLVYNIVGQKVATLFSGVQQAGAHKAVWDAAGVPSGVYFARLESGAGSRSIKMVVLK